MFSVGQSRSVGRAAFLSALSRGKPFPSSRDHLHSLACGHFLHLQSQQQSISDHSSIVTTPSDHRQERFSAFKDSWNLELSPHLKVRNLHHKMAFLPCYYRDLNLAIFEGLSFHLPQHSCKHNSPKIHLCCCVCQ